MEMKRIALPIQNENQINLICFNSNVFVQTISSLIYVPVQTEELSLADLIKSYKSELNLSESELTFDGILKFLCKKILKPIDKELLLVEALEQFILNYKPELEVNKINNNLTNEIEMNGFENCNLPPNLVKKLAELFAYTFNTEFMIQQLKRKQFNREFLIKIIDLLNKALNSSHKLATFSSNVIDWIDVILDSYFICLNSSNNLELIKHLNQIKIQNEKLIVKAKNEGELKCLLETLLLAIDDESDKRRKSRISLPDNKPFRLQT